MNPEKTGRNHKSPLLSPPQCIALCALIIIAGALSGCTPSIPITRGYILISIDTLRADHLSSYGYPRDTSPFIDELAARGIVFENAYVQLPGTLPSHMSIFTGLYPAEHGVYPQAGVLSENIETLPEVFQNNGFATAGYTEGGYVHGSYGFARGFDKFSDQSNEIYSDIERTLERGLTFLRGLEENERFFLFLHTYAVHDPYFPPDPYSTRYWDREKPNTFEPTGSNFDAFNRNKLPMSDSACDYYEALYDGTIRYADKTLGRFFDEIEKAGWLDDVTIILTSDHGEEFLEHGKMVHEQIYPENLHVPLIVVAPGLESRRVSTIVESIDIAPTLFSLAGIPAGRPISGRSLVPLMLGRIGERSEAYAESADRLHRTIITSNNSGSLIQIMQQQGRGAEEAVWVSREITFDVLKSRLVFRARSYHEPRTITIRSNEKTLAKIDLKPTGWTSIEVDLPPGPKKWRVTLATPECTSPRELEESNDPRCLSFLVKDLTLDRIELYNLSSDPLAQIDLSNREGDVAQNILDRMPFYERCPVAPPIKRPLDPALEQRLNELGYIN